MLQSCTCSRQAEGKVARICCQHIRRKMSVLHLQVPPKGLVIHTGTILAEEGKKQLESTSDASGHRHNIT